MDIQQTKRWAHPVAFAIVTLTIVCHYLWKRFPAEMQADIWNISMAVYSMLVTIAAGLVFRSRLVWLAVALSSGYFLQVAGCSAAYLISPWDVGPGEEQCSAGLHFPLGTLGLAVAMIVLSKITKKG